MYVSSFGPRTSTWFINSTFLGSQYNFDLLGISNFKEDLEGVRFVIPTFLYESKNQRSLFPKKKMPQNFYFISRVLYKIIFLQFQEVTTRLENDRSVTDIICEGVREDPSYKH